MIMRLLKQAGALLVVPAVLGWCAPAARADIGTEYTSGTENYSAAALLYDASLSRKANLGLEYRQVLNAETMPRSKTISANLGLRPTYRINLGIGCFVSPAADDSKSAGWDLYGRYAAGGGNSGWGFSLGFGSASMAEQVSYDTLVERRRRNGNPLPPVTVTSTEWLDVRQTHVDPGIDYSFFRRMMRLNLGFVKYGYDRDLADFSDRLAALSYQNGAYNPSFGGIQSLVDGFPDYTVSAGWSWFLFSRLEISVTRSHTGYALGREPSDSWLYGFSCDLARVFGVSVSRSEASYGEQYTTVGLFWIW